MGDRQVFFNKEWRVFPTRDVFEAMLDPTVVHFIGQKNSNVHRAIG